MNRADKRKRNNYDHQTSRPKKRSLRGPSIDDTKELNLDKLPLNCLRRILSFVTYEKVSEMRQVSNVFNKIGKQLLDKEHKNLEGLLKGEIEKAKRRRAHFSINARSSEDMLRFLNGLYEAINNCTKTYRVYNIGYFVAGKLLDEANYLLKDLNSSTVVPYFHEHVCDQKPHPLLGPISAHSEKAYRHFRTKIGRDFISFDSEAEGEIDQQLDLEAVVLREQNKKKTMKTNLLESMRRKIDCGNEMRGEFLKLILKLKENALDLTRRTDQANEDAERVINKTKISIVKTDESNCSFQLSTTPSSSPHSEAKIMGISSKKRHNLATLPSSCIRNIVSKLNCHEMTRMRTVSKSFNEECKKELNREYEKLKQKVEFYIEYIGVGSAYYVQDIIDVEANMMKDFRRFLQLCEDNYKLHLGSNYYFVAGKVLDEATCICNMLYRIVNFIGDDFNKTYKSRPHSTLFHLMDLVNKSIAHFKFNVVPKYFPSTQKPTYVPDSNITGDVMDSERESLLNLEEIEKLIEETEAKIKEQNDRNRKLCCV